PLAEVAQPLSPPTNSAEIEADAVILDLETCLAAVDLEPEPAMLGPRVATNIRECLPHDLDHLAGPVHQLLGRLGLHLHGRRQSSPKLKVPRKHQQGLVETVLAQDPGSPPKGAVAKVLDSAVDRVDTEREPFAQGWIRTAGHRILQASHDRRQR